MWHFAQSDRALGPHRFAERINPEVLDRFGFTKASRTGWLVVVCERSERLGGLRGPLDKRAKFGSLSWCLGWILGTSCRAMYQVANG